MASKFTLTIEVTGYNDLRHILDRLDPPRASTAAARSNGPADEEPATETPDFLQGQGDFPPDQGAAPAQDPDAKKVPAAKKGRPAKAPATGAREALAKSIKATDDTEALPPLDMLKAAVTNAVRAAQKGDGDRVILQLLPAFKEKTGLDFVMNATDTHRRALLDLVNASGLTLG